MAGMTCTIGWRRLVGRRVATLASVLVFGLLVAVLATPAVAFSAPTWLIVNPEGDVGDNRPVIQAYVDNSVISGGDGLDVTAPVDITLTVGGFPVATGEVASIDYPNGPADHSVAIVKLDLSGGDGLAWSQTYDVAASVTIGGATNSYAGPWQFYTDKPPVVTLVRPTPSTPVTDTLRRPIVSVTLDDPDDTAFTGEIGAGRFLRITRVWPLPTVSSTPANGSLPGTVIYNASTKTYSWQSLVALSDNATYVVDFAAADRASTVNHSWTFFVATAWQGAFTHVAPTVPVTAESGDVAITVDADDSRFAIQPSAPGNSMTLDGEPLAVSASAPAAGDDSIVRLSASHSLTDGPHRVITSVTDVFGLVGTDTWDFTVAVPPVAKDLSPTGTTGDPQPLISAKVTDNGPGSPTVVMTVDSAVVDAEFDAATGSLTYMPSAPFAVGSAHTVSLSMRDASGNESSASWTFRVDVINDAVFSGARPAPGAAVMVQPVPLRIIANSETPLVPNLTRLFVDGTARSVTTIHSAPGELQISGSAQELSVGSHTVRVVVTDEVGHQTEKTWEFAVAEIPPCTACHVGDLPNHAIPTPPCADCHNPGFPTIPRHTDEQISASHAGVADAQCAGCHEMDLIKLHAAYPDASLSNLCLRCHASDSEVVRSAVLAGDRSCSTCHPGVSANHQAAHDGGLTDDACTECHVSNIALEHDLDCALCHESIKRRVRAAIQDGVVTCPTCHGVQHRGGQDYLGAADPSAGSLAYVYLAWSDMASPTVSANTGSPHGGYVTTSVKCAICHSVHYAAPAESAAEPVADRLLRTTAKDACGYCHVAVAAGAGNPVFGGNVEAMGDAGHALGNPSCSECHANVHGTEAETEVASLRGSMLTLATDYGTGSPGGGSTILLRVAAIEASATAQGFGDDPKVTGFSVDDYRTLTGPAIENQAVGLFCNGCHDGSYAGTISGASASTYGGRAAGMFTGHVTMAAAANSAVAFSPAADCSSCHDADDGFGGKAFPHNWGVVPGQPLQLNEAGDGYTNQTFAWLLSGRFSGSELTTVGGPGGKQGHAGASGGTLSDGVCLKCHRSQDAGVGITY